MLPKESQYQMDTSHYNTCRYCSYCLNRIVQKCSLLTCNALCTRTPVIIMFAFLNCDFCLSCVFISRLYIHFFLQWYPGFWWVNCSHYICFIWNWLVKHVLFAPECSSAVFHWNVSKTVCAAWKTGDVTFTNRQRWSRLLNTSNLS